MKSIPKIDRSTIYCHDEVYQYFIIDSEGEILLDHVNWEIGEALTELKK